MALGGFSRSFGSRAGRQSLHPVPMISAMIDSPPPRSDAPLVPPAEPAAPVERVPGPELQPAKSILAAALRRCARVGLRLVVTAPGDVDTFSSGLVRFPERIVEATAHDRYTRAYRMFSDAASQVHDQASWRVLVLDESSHVVGAVTARFFCGDIGMEYVNALSLLAGYAPVLRNECALAVNEVFARAQRHARTPAEISHWAVASGPHARLILATLSRAMLALATAFDLPLAILAANHERGEMAHLVRWPAAPLGRQGKFYLPPFVHRATGARLRFLVIDSSALGGRLRMAAADLAVLRERCPIVSAQ